uniref:Serpentine receptor class gamma n=1 Tax=Panagrellus redivivus TaxID=6233 RepID=A0A7E4VVV6_PANRE
MQSMYPLFWTIGIEICFNIYSVASIGTLYLMGIVHENDGMNVLDSVMAIIRETVLIVYCFPFLIYSEKRRHTKFINKVNGEAQNEHNLYFKQLRAQW